MWASDASNYSHFGEALLLHFLVFHFLRVKVGYAKFPNMSLLNKLRVVVLSIKDIQIRCEVVGAAKITITQQQRTLFMQ